MCHEKNESCDQSQSEGNNRQRNMCTDCPSGTEENGTGLVQEH